MTTRRLVITTTAVMAVSTLMQYGLSAIGPLIVDDLLLSSAIYGSFFTVYFAVCALGSLFLGGPTERVGARWGMVLVGITASIGFVTVGLAPSLPMVYIGLLFSGLAGALSNPATNLALMNAPNRRPLVGIKQSGVQVSAIVGGTIVGPMAQALGWRGALLVCAIVAISIVIPALRTSLRNDDAKPSTPKCRKGSSITGLAAFSFVMGAGLATTIAYIPLYATADLGLSTSIAGQLLGIFGVCAVAGRIVWGYLSQLSSWFSQPKYSLGSLSGGALLATGLFGFSTTFPVLIFVGAITMGLTGAAWNGLVMASVMTSAKAGASGRAAGRVQAAFFSGLCLSPLVFGWIVDQTQSFDHVWAGSAILYVMAIVVTQTFRVK